ncbi:unnamed protein product [Durusdinium trenchii]|uniref:Secreted protein n=1 Tax=Durusdinium trenchii TaxID=1381693 RepID=A0ABP0NLR2_9DINO
MQNLIFLPPLLAVIASVHNLPVADSVPSWQSWQDTRGGRVAGDRGSSVQLGHKQLQEEAMQQSFLEPSNLQRIAWSSNQGPKVPFCESRAGPPMFFLIGKAGLIFALRFIAHVAWMRCLETCKLAKLLAPGKRCLLVLRDTF